MKHLVPILDEGVSLDYGDYVIVVLDAVAVPTPYALADAVDQLLGKIAAPTWDQRQQQTEEER